MHLQRKKERCLFDGVEMIGREGSHHQSIIHKFNDKKWDGQCDDNVMPMM
jgi:hypothetical protein